MLGDLIANAIKAWRTDMSARTSVHAKPILGIASGLIGVTLLTFGALVSSPQPARATAAYSKQTGMACGRCHVNPAGGGPNTAFGKAFAANGHTLPSKKK